VFRDLARVVVLVEDQDDALRFYRDVLGFHVLHDEVTGGYRYLHVGVPGQDRVGVWLMPPVSYAEQSLVGRQAGGQPLLVLYADDLDAVARRLSEHGVEVWAQRDDDTGRSLHFRDVAGNVLIAAEHAPRGLPPASP
jgi:catechol 2,3-dioxygenase-like lactoylglutathione lyase family enzyme